MFRLKALLWRSYKVRLRSTLLSSLELMGPIILILIYLALKMTVENLNLPKRADVNATNHLFREVTSKPLNPRSDLAGFICNKIPYYSQIPSDNLRLSLENNCGIELVATPSRRAVFHLLEKSLKLRVNHVEAGKDLNRPNATSECLRLPGILEPMYQVGLVIKDNRTFELIMTDSIGTTIIFQPFYQGSSYNEYKFAHSDLNSGLILIETCLINSVMDQSKTSAHTTSSNSTDPSRNHINWHYKPFPTTRAPMVPPLMFMICFFLASFCDVIALTFRIVGERESGFHQYLRTSGVSASSYWMSHFLTMTLHLVIQSFILAILLALPAGTTLIDTVYLTNISIRWLFVFIYLEAMCTHTLFLSLLVNKQTHLILLLILICPTYALQIHLVHNYNAYGFTHFHKLSDLMYWTPPPLFTLLLFMMIALYLQTGEPLSFSQLSMGIIGGGVTTRTFGELWLQLIIQIPLWLFLTILVDELSFVPSYTPVGIINSLMGGLCCCGPLGGSRSGPIENIKTTSASKFALDPNRVCCSIRHLSILGPNGYAAQARGDPLKMTPEQVSRFYHTPDKSKSTTYRYFLKSDSNSNQPVLLDDMIEQHIVWVKTRLGFEDLCINFRFNQVTFILGQPDLKELLFDAILGLRPIRSGHIIIDGNKFTPETVGFCRSYIGYLGAKDIFLNELSILENLKLFGSLRDPNYSEFDSESKFLLKLLHLTNQGDARPSALTRRSTRKLSLASAAVGRTKLLLLVEPTLSLRWKPRCQVLNLLKKYKSIRSIVVDTSDIDEAAAFGDRVVFFRDGKTDLDGTPSQLDSNLACGHRIVLIGAGGDALNTTIEGLRRLETLTDELFGTEKLEKLLLVDGGASSTVSRLSASKSPSQLSSGREVCAILGIHYSLASSEALLRFLKMFENEAKVHEFKLYELRYESLEDVIVNRMSKAIYPDLPPDLLLSLTHRNQAILADREDSQFVLRRFISNFPHKGGNNSIYNSTFRGIMRDRLAAPREILTYLFIMLISLIVVAFALLFLRESLQPNYFRLSPTTKDKRDPSAPTYEPMTGAPIVYFSVFDEAYSNQVGLVVMDQTRADGYYRQIETMKHGRYSEINLTTAANPATVSNTSVKEDLYLNKFWYGNWRFSGLSSDMIKPANSSDEFLVLSLIRENRESPASLIFFAPDKNEAVIVFEPYAPRILAYSIKMLSDYQLFLSSSSQKIISSENPKHAKIDLEINQTSQSSGYEQEGEAINESYLSADRIMYHQASANRSNINLSHHSFLHPWNEMIRGYLVRRFHYAVAFSLVEGITLGMFLLAPVRHKSSSSNSVHIRLNYWLSMGLFDLIVSLVHILGYIGVIVLIDGADSTPLILALFLVFILYKWAILPVPYLISMVAQSVAKGWLFLVLFVFAMGWIFGLQIRVLLEWTLIGQGYFYNLIDWMLIFFPTNALFDSLTIINHIGRMNKLCPLVPSYLATGNQVELEGIQTTVLNDLLVDKLSECLTNGKTGISTNVFNQHRLGILSAIYLTTLFGSIVWLFLLFSQRVFGILRSSTEKASTDPLKTIVRSSPTTSSGYKWHLEKDRLVSEYARCMNEQRYVNRMSRNCLILRVWLRPMSDRRSIERRLASIVSPLVALGLAKSDFQIVLKTTLQIFIRLGSDSSCVKSKRTQIFQTYLEYIKVNGDSVSRFALVDWTQEALYKLLLHGHYNIRSTSP